MKKDGYYYVLAPAGGVATGWQVALRSKNIYGPYEARNVLHQGGTGINGPHQGGLVGLDSGEWWFMHFQDRDLYGRIVHLQPVNWRDGWPMMGEDTNNDAIGEPVMEWKKPDVGKSYPAAIPQTSDEFNNKKLALQWQWHANPQPHWYSLNRKSPGHMRLYAERNITQFGNLYFVPNLLLQKFPAPAFSATTRIDFYPADINDKSGLVVMGQEWAYIALHKTADGVRLGMFTGLYDREKDGTVERESVKAEASANNQYTYYLKVQVETGGKCRFLYSLDGRSFTPIGVEFQAKKGVWIGAKVGISA
jgi:beta-xylosidase